MAVTLTERAAEEVKKVITDAKFEGTTYLRVGVKGGGCGGFGYMLDLVDNVGEKDKKFEQHGVTIVCDPKSYLYLNGVEIDFKEELMGRGFAFSNPNAKSSCGCGSSFTA